MPPKVPLHILKIMWEQWKHDFTWICTHCLLDHSDYDNIDDFREHLKIDCVEFRQARTKPNMFSLAHKANESLCASSACHHVATGLQMAMFDVTAAASSRHGFPSKAHGALRSKTLDPTDFLELCLF